MRAIDIEPLRDQETLADIEARPGVRPPAPAPWMPSTAPTGVASALPWPVTCTAAPHQPGT
jgi:hypothetical protein